MAFFSQKPKQETAKAAPEVHLKPKNEDKKEVGKKEGGVGAKTKADDKKTSSRFPFEVLVSSHVTEKAMKASESNYYTFMVSLNATKPQIRRSVEKLFNVHVVTVRVVNTLGKKVRFGKASGKQNDKKKAMVAIKKGETITL